jgi:site-specific DNA recombinase
MTADAEHLRIVDKKTWDRVQARLGDRAGTPHKARPVRLLSGLVKCGKCGSGYIGGGTDKRGVRLVCSRHREAGLCENTKSVPREWIEQRVLKGIETHLADPELVAEYVCEYHRMTRELNSKAGAQLRAIDKKLGNVTGEISRLVDAIASGAVAARAVGGKIAALEAEQDRLEQERATVGLDRVEFHPNAADAYRAKIRSLKRTLSEAGEESRQAAFAGIREIVEKVVIHPGGKYQPPENRDLRPARGDPQTIRSRCDPGVAEGNGCGGKI